MRLLNAGMRSSMKNIFFNPELQYLRSGWRVAIFLVVLLVCTVALGVPVGLALREIPSIDIQPVKLFFTYLFATLATWFMLRFIDKRPFASIGLTFNAGWGKELLQGCGIGAGMISIVFIIEYFCGMVQIEFFMLSYPQALYVFVYSFFLYSTVGYGEELLFRGYLLQVTAEGIGKASSAILYALLFAVSHVQNPNVSIFGLINIALAGIWLAIAYYKTRALWLPIGLHFSWNFFQGFVYSFPVSGTASNQEQIGKAIVFGPEWITGGAFGPEGGALTTLLLAASSFFIYKSKWITAAKSAWKYEEWKAVRMLQVEVQQTENAQQ